MDVAYLDDDDADQQQLAQHDPEYNDMEAVDDEQIQDLEAEEQLQELLPIAAPALPDVVLKASHLTIPACINATTSALEQRMADTTIGVGAKRKLKTFASFCRTSVHMNLNINDPCLQGIRMVPGEQPGGGGPRGDNARVDSFWMKDSIEDTCMEYARCIVGMQQLAYAHSAISCATLQQRQPVEAVVMGMSQQRAAEVCKLQDPKRIPHGITGWQKAVCQYSAALMPRVQGKEDAEYKDQALLGYHLADAVRLKEALHKASKEMTEED